MNIIEDQNKKIVKSLRYNYVFDKNNGFFARWGITKEDDPEFSPFGPEIADIEISSANADDIKNANDDTIITNGGCSGIGCSKFCYKKNTSNKTAHMSLNTFKKVLDRFNGNLTQIAFGLCSLNSHPQLWDIFKETKKRGIVSNVTINGIATDEECKKLAEHCGAVAVSVNKANKDIAYDTIKRLSQDNGMSQINIHIVLAEDTIPFIKEVVEDMTEDSRLSKMNALVMLSFKDKAKTGCYSPISQNSYNQLVAFMEEKNVKFGFDSCSAPLYAAYIKGKKNEKELGQMAEPCESLLFSCYISFDAKLTCCSFLEGIEDSINILDYDNIIDVWYSNKVKKWRKKLLENKRNCPHYMIGK